MSTAAGKASPARIPPRAYLIIVLGGLLLTITFGIRQGFGLFLKPMSQDLGIGFQTIGLALAIQSLLSGLVQPFTGMIADRYGSGRVIAAGGLLYLAGLLLTPLAAGGLALQFTLGVLVGVGLTGTTFAVVFGAASRAVPPEQRAVALTIVSTFGSAGLFVFVPLTQALLDSFGWMQALLWLAAITALIPLFAIVLRGKPEKAVAVASEAGSLRAALGEASRHPGYRLLNIGFFVCGFHVTFMAVHLPAYLTEGGLTPMAAASALATVGLFNILGSLLCGWAGARYRKKYVLSLLYFARAVAIAAFIAAPLSELSAHLFAAAIGVLWLGTVPVTSSLVAQIFGVRYLATLFGIVFMSHQVGAFIGAWFGGYIFDATGSYTIVWYVAIALGVLSGLVHLPILDRPLLRAHPLPA